MGADPIAAIGALDGAIHQCTPRTPASSPAPPSPPHFSETGADIAEAFEQAGYSSVLRLADHGTWIGLADSSE
jgi:hypothetical protein